MRDAFCYKLPSQKINTIQEGHGLDKIIKATPSIIIHHKKGNR